MDKDGRRTADKKGNKRRLMDALRSYIPFMRSVLSYGKELNIEDVNLKKLKALCNMVYRNEVPEEKLDCCFDSVAKLHNSYYERVKAVKNNTKKLVHENEDGIKTRSLEVGMSTNVSDKSLNKTELENPIENSTSSFFTNQTLNVDLEHNAKQNTESVNEKYSENNKNVEPSKSIDSNNYDAMLIINDPSGYPDSLATNATVEKHQNTGTTDKLSQSDDNLKGFDLQPVSFNIERQAVIDIQKTSATELVPSLPSSPFKPKPQDTTSNLLPTSIPSQLDEQVILGYDSCNSTLPNPNKSTPSKCLTNDEKGNGCFEILKNNSCQIELKELKIVMKNENSSNELSNDIHISNKDSKKLIQNSKPFVGPLSIKLARQKAELSSKYDLVQKTSKKLIQNSKPFVGPLSIKLARQKAELSSKYDLVQKTHPGFNITNKCDKNKKLNNSKLLKNESVSSTANNLINESNVISTCKSTFIENTIFSLDLEGKSVLDQVSKVNQYVNEVTPTVSVVPEIKSDLKKSRPKVPQLEKLSAAISEIDGEAVLNTSNTRQCKTNKKVDYVSTSDVFSKQLIGSKKLNEKQNYEFTQKKGKPKKVTKKNKKSAPKIKKNKCSTPTVSEVPVIKSDRKKSRPKLTELENLHAGIKVYFGCNAILNTSNIRQCRTNKQIDYVCNDNVFSKQSKVLNVKKTALIEKQNYEFTQKKGKPTVTKKNKKSAPKIMKNKCFTKSYNKGDTVLFGTTENIGINKVHITHTNRVSQLGIVSNGEPEIISQVSNEIDFNDINYFQTADNLLNCKFCHYSDTGLNIVRHYKDKHHNVEVLPSRLSSELASILVSQSLKENYGTKISEDFIYFNKSNSRQDVNFVNFSCVFCQVSFYDSVNFVNHISAHTGEYRYKCKMCEHVSVNGYDLEEHILQHPDYDKTGGISIFLYPDPIESFIVLGHLCFLCNYVQLDYDNMVEHMKKWHYYEDERSNGYWTIVRINMSFPGELNDLKPIIDLTSKIKCLPPLEVKKNAQKTVPRNNDNAQNIEYCVSKNDDISELKKIETLCEVVHPNSNIFLEPGQQIINSGELIHGAYYLIDAEYEKCHAKRVKELPIRSMTARMAFKKLMSSSGILTPNKCMDRPSIKVFSDKEEFKLHMNVHFSNTDEKKGVFLSDAEQFKKCVYCLEVFVDENALAVHIANTYNFCVYFCPICLYYAYTESHVLVHQLLIHNMSKPSILKLDLDNNFEHPKEMLKVVDFNEYVLPYVCSHGTCHFYCYLPSDFLSHLNKEHQQCDKFCCHICANQNGDNGFFGFKPKHLIEHFTSHNINKYQCIFCLFGTEVIDLLVSHLSMEHFEFEPICLERSPKSNISDTKKIENLKILRLQKAVDNESVLTMNLSELCGETSHKTDDRCLESDEVLSSTIKSANIDENTQLSDTFVTAVCNIAHMESGKSLTPAYDYEIITRDDNNQNNLGETLKINDSWTITNNSEKNPQLSNNDIIVIDDDDDDEIVLAHNTLEKGKKIKRITAVVSEPEKRCTSIKKKLSIDNSNVVGNKKRKELLETKNIVQDKSKYLSFSPDTIESVPKAHIFSNPIGCSLCGYNTRVRYNLIAHLYFHEIGQHNTTKETVNPVVCIDKSKNHVDLSFNQSASSFEAMNSEKNKTEEINKKIVEVPYPIDSNLDLYPIYVPRKKRFSCVKPCTHTYKDDAH